MYVTSKNIRMGFMDLDDVEHISEAEHRGIFRRCDVRRGDLLLTKDGANTGNVCINECDEEFSLLSSVALLRANPASVDARFLQTYLASEESQSRLTGAMSGNAITRLTLEKIKAFEIYVPELDSQTAIADCVESHDERVRSEHRYLLTLLQLREGVERDLFSGRVRFPAEVLS